MYTIISGGCMSMHTKDFQMTRPNGFPHYVLLNIHSKAFFTICSQTYSVEPGYAVLISPQTPYEYTSQDSYNDDWLHFDIDSSKVKELIHGLPDVNIPFPVSHSELYTTLFRQILWENSYSPLEIQAKNIDSLFSLLLNHMSYECSHPEHTFMFTPYYRELQSIRLEMKNEMSAEHSIQEYAGRLSLSSSYFQHLYKNQFGVSFQKDLINLRIDYAKDLLVSTTLSVKDIAEACGYRSEIHFHRQFKELVLMTPAQYKKSQM